MNKIKYKLQCNKAYHIKGRQLILSDLRGIQQNMSMIFKMTHKTIFILLFKYETPDNFFTKQNHTLKHKTVMTPRRTELNQRFNLAT